MKHKVCELDGGHLNAAVALAEGWRPVGEQRYGWDVPVGLRGADTFRWEGGPSRWSSDWQHGGPIIERERIELVPCGLPDSPSRQDDWYASCRPANRSGAACSGSTPLIAAMRAYVASKLGEEVEL